ncbi:MAG: rRNA pseudouridine synthase [Planctomycetes bacterium]|nr:rRNA pseudouridine synthase [Planctomycetota bacterium]
MEDTTNSSTERLHKFLARSGAASRRECEDFIRNGRVTVDGSVVRSMGVVVDGEQQDVRLDGERVHCDPAASYVVYKPPGVVCTTDDQFGRTAVTDLVRARFKRKLFSVGRMEEESEGLIIVTNDGDLASKVLKRGHPLRQTWFLKVHGIYSPDKINQLREGVWLSDGKTGPIWVQVLRAGPNVTTLLASPSISQHRMLRRAFAKVGLVADKVVRIRIGHLTTENLKERGWRRLSPEDVARLMTPHADDQQPMGLKAPPPSGRRAKNAGTYSVESSSKPQRAERSRSAPARGRKPPTGRRAAASRRGPQERRDDPRPPSSGRRVIGA